MEVTGKGIRREQWVLDKDTGSEVHISHWPTGVRDIVPYAKLTVWTQANLTRMVSGEKFTRVYHNGRG